MTNISLYPFLLTILYRLDTIPNEESNEQICSANAEDVV